MISILLVDDHLLFRAGLKAILAQAGDMSVEAEADSGEEALDQLRKKRFDVALMDIHMPGIGGIEATRRIVHLFPQTKVIALTAASAEPFPDRLLDAGASGFLTKGCQAAELFSAIRTVRAGNHYLAASIAQKLALGRFIEKGAESPLSKLSAREMQVMQMICQGMDQPKIAEELFVSPKTISTYRSRLCEKLAVSNDVELTRLAMRYGLIE